MRCILGTGLLVICFASQENHVYSTKSTSTEMKISNLEEGRMDTEKTLYLQKYVQ
jgi:hypothetical protein